jgi:bacillithiol synthase
MLETSSQFVAHSETNAFNNIVLDYVNQNNKLSDFYNLYPSIENIQKFINAKQLQNVDRITLVQVLQNQYQQIENKTKTTANIELLLQENTFTICTAHQPIIFGGPLYFIYKIAHAIHLANTLQKKLPTYNFVPVFYMGSEDADIEEIGTCNIEGKQYSWEPNQGGASGRISTDSLQKIVADVLAIINTQNVNGIALQTILENAYNKNLSLNKATLQLIHSLFGDYGLVILIPDNSKLKKLFVPIMQKEITERKSENIVQQTSKTLEANYKTQAHARQINLFYLGDGFRERIEYNNNLYRIANKDIQFTEEEIIIELKKYPEKFSPNVILRGVFQECILPNVAFIGGGGELAYWLQIKEVFAHYNIPFPPIVLRQSFLLKDAKDVKSMQYLNITDADIFKNIDAIHKKFILQSHDWQDLQAEKDLQIQLIDNYKIKAKLIMPQLSKSILAYEAKYKKLQEAIEKKFVAHSKRKQADSINAITKLKQKLSPNGNLQERMDNFIPYYNLHGSAFIDDIINNCTLFGEDFKILTLTDN